MAMWWTYTLRDDWRVCWLTAWLWRLAGAAHIWARWRRAAASTAYRSGRPRWCCRRRRNSRNDWTVTRRSHGDRDCTASAASRPWTDRRRTGSRSLHTQATLYLLQSPQQIEKRKPHTDVKHTQRYSFSAAGKLTALPPTVRLLTSAKWIRVAGKPWKLSSQCGWWLCSEVRVQVLRDNLVEHLVE